MWTTTRTTTCSSCGGNAGHSAHGAPGWCVRGGDVGYLGGGRVFLLHVIPLRLYTFRVFQQARCVCVLSMCWCKLSS